MQVTTPQVWLHLRTNSQFVEIHHLDVIAESQLLLAEGALFAEAMTAYLNNEFKFDNFMYFSYFW